jgi:hypothetical protein
MAADCRMFERCVMDPVPHYTSAKRGRDISCNPDDAVCIEAGVFKCSHKQWGDLEDCGAGAHCVDYPTAHCKAN